MSKFYGSLAFTLALSAIILAADDYTFGPDSNPSPNVPTGKIEKRTWKSNVFPETVRDWWIYTPAQYDPAKPASIMVFQDGGSYMNEKGQFRATVVFDNLIHKKQMPVTIGIFLNPGSVPSADSKGKARSNRSFEYDTLSSVRHFSGKGNTPRGGKNPQHQQKRQGPCHLWHKLRRYLRIYRGMGTPRPIQQGFKPCGKFHQYSWRGCLPGYDS